MRLKLLGCKVLSREVGYLSSFSQNYIDTTWLRQGYHNEPDRLRQIIQENIDRIDSGDDPYSCSTEVGDYDAILLGYGLCSNGICGVSSKRYRIVVPKAHDCITLFLGSKERYKQIFESKSGGIYWYTAGWIENSIMPSKLRDELTYNHYIKEYGEDNADYLYEMNAGWMKDYKAAAYVELDGLNMPKIKEYTKECADHYNWEFLDYVGDTKLLTDFLEGNWDEESFLIVEPNQTIDQSFDSHIVKTVSPDKVSYMDGR